MSKTRKRILAAIMFTDIKGYTALMQKDETIAIETRTRHRKIFRETMDKYEGEILQYFGDGTLSIFYSAVDAVRCGIEMQTSFLTEPKIPVRIGIHIGDIIYDQVEIIGDSVNIAARLESLATPGSLLISDKVYQEVKNHKEIIAHFVGKVFLKNVNDSLTIYSIINKPLVIPSLIDISAKSGVDPIKIAVLPLYNIGLENDDEFFCDGISEEILNVLAKIDAFQVTSRTSSFYFKNKNIPIQDIAESLKVDYILEGSIRRAGNKIRITSQLIEIKNDMHLWSDKYDRNIDDVFAVQDEIANEIATQLSIKFNLASETIKSRRKISAAAHSAYLKARFYFNHWAPEYVVRSIDSFKEAIKLDEAYAAAYAGIAGSYIFLGITGYDNEGFQKAKNYAEKAFELNKENEESILALAMVRSLYDKNIEEANSLFNKAIRIRPDYATGHHYFAMHLAYLGNLSQSIIEYQKAADLDPLSLPINAEYASALATLGYYEKASNQINKTLVLNPSFRTAWEIKGWIFYQMGDYKSSLSAFTKYHSFTDAHDKGILGLAVVNIKLGNKHKAKEYLDLMLKRKVNNPDLSIDMDLAMIHLALEEIDDALDYLESALSKQQGSLFLNTMPFLKQLSGNERFEALKRRYLPRQAKVLPKN